nr:hypothetical protein [Tanacetum cinerariifolium]
ESDEEETRQEEDENFDPIPRTPEESEEESNDEEEQESRLSEEVRIKEEEDAEELYRDVNINQGRGLQVTQRVEDTHVILTPVNPDDPQESSSMSSFVSSMLNPLSDEGVESIFTTTSSQIVFLEPPTTIMTPSTIATITTSGEAPIPPPTIPSIILENLLTFNSAFRFEERLRLLETSFYEYRQTNQVVDAMAAIPSIVHQYMDQQMKEAVREAVQIQTDQLQDSLQRENDEFLRNIDENMKNVLKGLVKNQVKEQVSRILPRVEESVNATLEAEVLTRSLHSSRTSYAVAADLSEMELKKILIEKMEGNKSIQRSDEQRNLYKALVEAYEADKAILDTYGDSTILKRRREDDDQEGPSAGPNQGSKRQKEGEEPVQTTCQMEETPLSVYETGADDQPIVQTSQHPEWFSQPRKPPSPDRKLSNLTVEERLAFNVSLRMFTRSIVIQRHVEDLQLGVERYQKKLNLMRPDTYRSDLKRHEAYTAYSNPRGFIYQNKDKKNRLMRIDELYKFSDGTLNDVRTALNDHLKGIRMQYLPSTI